MVYSYDLLSEPWIPCRSECGEARHLSLRALYREAHHIQRLEHESPLVLIGLYRLLLAITHRVMRGPQDAKAWRSLWKAGLFDQSLFDAYFDQWVDRFDLFDEKYPFYQVGGFTTVDKKDVETAPKAISVIIQEASSGNNGTLFSHDIDQSPSPLAADQAILYLLASQAYALGGGIQPRSNLFGAHPNATHAPMVGSISTILLGENLFETLSLNLVSFDHREIRTSDSDLPVWERTHTRVPTKLGTEIEYLDYLTYSPKYIRLLPTGSPSSPRVAQLYISQGMSLEQGVRNPMAFYRADKKQGEKMIGLRRDRAIWRDSSTLFHIPTPGQNDRRPLALTQTESRTYRRLLKDKTLKVQCLALCNDKAKAEYWATAEFPIPVELLDDQETYRHLSTFIEWSESGYEAFREACRRFAYLLLTRGEVSPDKDNVTRVANQLIAYGNYWWSLEGVFSAFIRQLSSDEELDSKVHLEHIKQLTSRSFEIAADKAQGTRAQRYRAQVSAERKLKDALAKLSAV